MSDPATPIAFVTARYPPMTSSGTFRVQAAMRYLPEHGFAPRVVTIPTDWVARAGSREMAAMVPTEEEGVLRPEASHDGFVRRMSSIPKIRWLTREALVPDYLAPWSRQVAGQVARDLSDVQLVYATSPPFSAMALGRRLGEMLGVPVVQELRDPPSFNRSLQWRSESFRRRMRRFAARQLADAEQIIVVTPRTRQHMLEIHDLDPDRVHVVTNGYPEIDVDPGLSTRDPSVFTVTYVGSFQGGFPGRESSWFTPEIVSGPLQRLDVPSELRVVGPVTARQRSSLEAQPGTRILGQVSRQQALAEVAAADVSLILADEQDWWIGRKAFEALAYAKRILAIVAAGDTADLLAPSSKSIVSPVGDMAALESSLRRLADEWERGVEPKGPEPSVQSDASCYEQVAEVLRMSLRSSNSSSGV